MSVRSFHGPGRNEMRALLLILIGGGLIWLLIQGLGPSLAKDPGQQNSAGTLLHEEPQPAGENVAPAPVETQTQAPRANPVAPGPAPAAPVAAPTAIAAPASEKSQVAAVPAPSSPARPSAAELEVAARLVHQTAGFVEWLDSAQPAIPSGRRDFARALGLQLTGRSDEAGTLVHEVADSKELSEDERKLLGYWPQGPTFALPASGSGSGSLLLRAAGLASIAHAGQEALDAARWPEAANAFSRLLQEELDSAWDPDLQRLTTWAEDLDRAQRGYRWDRKGAWPALELKVNPGDSLISIRKQALQQMPALITCTGLIARANQLQGETIQPGQVLRVPTARPRVLIDLGARWLLFLQDEEAVAAWPIGIGKPGSETPPGIYRIGEKSTDPTWFRPGQPPVPAGDARNPLGTRWLAWVSERGEKTHLGIHGTRDPESIGQDESEGCVRMLNRHVEELYEIVPRGTEVLVRP